eukprot:scaffold22640_cov138-Cylindrotheca_fusiformis.AAC.4
MVPKFSGIQKEVFGLYRTILREAAKKDRAANTAVAESKVTSLWSNKETSSSYARNEFRKQALKIPKKDFKTVEHKIRQGYKQVKLLKMPGVKVVGGS